MAPLTVRIQDPGPSGFPEVLRVADVRPSSAVMRVLSNQNRICFGRQF